jgi:glutaredoxin
MPDLAMKSYAKENGVYVISLIDSKTKEDRGKVYVTSDSRIIFPAAIDTMAPVVEEPKAEATPAKAPESTVKATQKPEVQVFVMSYCPFGLQAEKMFLPVYDLLKDKASMGVYYVNYIMHGFTEAEQNVRQYCISSEQSDKFSKYLSCFVKTDKHADCAKEAKIDEAKLATCFEATMKKYSINDKSEAFPIHDELNKKYGVQGSPTVIINGTEVSVNRSPEDFKKAVCDAFTVKPKECETVLSKTVASPGIGEGEGTSGGSCN